MGHAYSALGLDRGIIYQYLLFVRSALTGSFGHSYSLNASVGSLIAQGMGKTVSLIVMAGIGLVVGFVVSMITENPSLSAWKKEISVLPFPHHYAKYPDGITLRFAMVHDVLHERYTRHGKAYYSERNRRARDRASFSRARKSAPGDAWRF